VTRTVAVLVLAALLEVGGDALTRIGLQGRYLPLAAGAAMLIVYGIVVNQSRLDFARLMGAYIAIFFVVSQVVALGLFHRMPDARTILGGLLIVVGGAILIL
jgi:drug/metabolite transporter superfamily protein YnfA